MQSGGKDAKDQPTMALLWHSMMPSNMATVLTYYRSNMLHIWEKNAGMMCGRYRQQTYFGIVTENGKELYLLYPFAGYCQQALFCIATENEKESQLFCTLVGYWWQALFGIATDEDINTEFPAVDN